MKHNTLQKYCTKGTASPPYLKEKMRVRVKSFSQLTKLSLDFQNLRSDIFVKTKKFAKPLLSVHHGAQIESFKPIKKWSTIMRHCPFKISTEKEHNR